MNQQPQDETTYYFRPTHGHEADIARLVEQHRAIAQVVKLFPKHFKLRGDETILDIGCGPGSWLINVGFKYQDVSCIGIDISKDAVNYAMLRAKMERIDNVTFEVADATQTLPFSDESVDYINIALANSFLLKEQWPLLFAECARILRSGGWVRSVETLATQTSSDSQRATTRAFERAIASSGRRYNGEITSYISPMMVQAGLVPTPLMTEVLDFSEDTPAHHNMSEDCYIAATLGIPFAVKSGVISEEELRQHIAGMQRDMQLPHFYGLVFFSDISAQKR